MTNQQEDIIQSNTNPLNAIPLERLSIIHQNAKTYHQKWDKDKVVQIADLSTIDNTYTALLHNLSKITSATGAGIYLYGEINDSSNYYKGIGGTITVTSLGIDFLVSSYRERRYRPEERKKEKDQFTTEIENLYNSYEELITLLHDLRDSGSLQEFSKLVNSLKKELMQIIQEGEIKENNNWEQRLSYIFWSLEKDKSSDAKELILLNNGVKALDSWDNLSFSGKAQSWLNSLLISRRNDTGWTEWKQKWEDRRNEHQKIKHLVSILQTAISEYQQSISSEEIEKGIKERMLKLKTDEDNISELEKEPLASTSNNNSSSKLLEDKNTPSIGSTSQPANVRKRTISNSKENRSSQEIYELLDLQSKEELQTKIEVTPK